MLLYPDCCEFWLRVPLHCFTSWCSSKPFQSSPPRPLPRPAFSFCPPHGHSHVMSLYEEYTQVVIYTSPAGSNTTSPWRVMISCSVIWLILDAGCSVPSIPPTSHRDTPIPNSTREKIHHVQPCICITWVGLGPFLDYGPPWGNNVFLIDHTTYIHASFLQENSIISEQLLHQSLQRSLEIRDVGQRSKTSKRQQKRNE